MAKLKKRKLLSKPPLSEEAIIEVCWRTWLVVITVSAYVVFVSELVDTIDNLPPEVIGQNCQPLWPNAPAYGPICF